MKIAVLGTGMVGNAIASKLVALGHEVMMGSRTANNVSAAEWVRTAGARGAVGTFADAGAFGELVFNCMKGAGSLATLTAAGTANLADKIVVDVANVLSPERAGSESLGEHFRRPFRVPGVVKTLNTINCELMVNQHQSRSIASPMDLGLSEGEHCWSQQAVTSCMRLAQLIRSRRPRSRHVES